MLKMFESDIILSLMFRHPLRVGGFKVTVLMFKLEQNVFHIFVPSAL